MNSSVLKLVLYFLRPIIFQEHWHECWRTVFSQLTGYGVQVDQRIKFQVFYTHHNRPEHLRRLEYYDPVPDRTYVYLTNIFCSTLLPLLSIIARVEALKYFSSRSNNIYELKNFLAQARML